MNRKLTLTVVTILLAGGCVATPGDPGYTGIFANRVVAFDPVNSTGATVDDWPYFFQPEAALGAPGEAMSGVVSLGYDLAAGNARGGAITLGLGEGAGGETFCVEDGPGADLAVYENPFFTTDPETGEQGTNSEAATVEVSQDGSAWFGFAPSVDESKSPADPSRYHHLAGITPTAEGGDRFDLADLSTPLPPPAGYQACYVRLSDGGTLYPDFGNSQSDWYASGADIDAVEALHPVASPGRTP